MSWGRLSATLATKFGVRHQRASERAREREKERAQARAFSLAQERENVALVERLGARLQA